MKLRTEIAPLVVHKTAAWLADRAVEILDRKCLAGESAGSSLQEAQKEMREKQEETRVKHYRNPDVDFSFEIAVLPLGRRVLGLYYTEQEDFARILRDKPWFIDYDYQNATDKDEDVPAREWRRRGKDWNKIDVPAMQGFGATIVSETFRPSPNEKEILAELPTFECRVADRVMDRLFEEYCKTLEGPTGSGNCVSRMMDFHEWRTTETARQYRDAIKVDVQQRLIPHLGWQDLINHQK